MFGISVLSGRAALGRAVTRKECVSWRSPPIVIWGGHKHEAILRNKWAPPVAVSLLILITYSTHLPQSVQFETQLGETGKSGRGVPNSCEGGA
jgi:hypothetical protein